MDEEHHARYLAEIRPRYVADRMRSDRLTRRQTERFVDAQWRQLLPHGSRTADHYFLNAVVSVAREPIGQTWLHLDPNTRASYIYDLVVVDAARSQGYGRGLLAAIERFLAAKGATTIGLNVFAWNRVARSLYESSGFETMSSFMSKVIGSPAP